MADDLGWNDVGYHGGNIDTPSLDKLAEQGVQLNRFYTTPICSPTRAALMTGRDPMRLGIAYGVILPWDNIGVNPASISCPSLSRRRVIKQLWWEMALGSRSDDLSPQSARL